MSANGGTDKLGGRPAADAQSGCARETGGKRCGHPEALHGRERGACRAFSCTAGPDGQPCPGFVAAKATAAA